MEISGNGYSKIKVKIQTEKGKLKQDHYPPFLKANQEVSSCQLLKGFSVDDSVDDLTLTLLLPVM